MKETFKAYLKGKSFSAKSINRRMVIINLFWEWLAQENLEVDQVGYSDIMAYMKYKSVQGVSQRTVQNYISVVKHFYEHLIREEQIVVNPVTDIKVKGVKRRMLYHTLEAHELHRLYNQYPEDKLTDSRNKVMLGLLVYQGVKTDELGKLEVNNIKLKEGIIEVPGGIRSNGRSMKLEAHQVMGMYDYILRVRQLILDTAPKRKTQVKQESNKLFIGDGGNCYSISNFITQLMIKVRKQNPSVKNAQQLRASVITKWLKMYNLREVQYLAGHRHISSTEDYLENDIDGLQEEVEQFCPIS